MTHAPADVRVHCVCTDLNSSTSHIETHLEAAIHHATNTEDGGISLYPQTRYVIVVSLRIDAIYRTDYYGTMTLNRWEFCVEEVYMAVYLTGCGIGWGGWLT